MGGKAATCGSVVKSSTTNQITSAAALVSLRQADDLLVSCAKNKGEEKIREEIKSRLHAENWVRSVFVVINDSKTSVADLRFLSKVFEKIVQFVISDPAPLTRDNIKPVLLSVKVDFDKFLNELSKAEIPCYGASLWLAYCKLFVTLLGIKMPSKEWNDLFAPMETWFKISDEDALKACLRVWTSFISFAAPKLSSGTLREKLLATFSKPLRSHAVMNKLKSSTPIISAYTTLISAFRANVDDRFEELIVCFLRFLIGSPVIALEDVKTIENEIAKPIDQQFKLVLEGATSDFLDYLVDSRPHCVFKDSLKHLVPLICSVLGTNTSKQGIPVCANLPTIMQKYGVFLTQTVRFVDHSEDCETDANSVCLCFAALGRRIETINDEGAQRRESRFLFIQIRAWIAESHQSIEEIESALCHLFRGGDLSIHANTVGEWPAINLLGAILKKSRQNEQDIVGKSSAKIISKFLELIPGTLRGGLETDGIVLKRLGELCDMIEGNIDCFDVQSMLKTWSHLADLLTDFIKETDDANEGNLLEPDFSKTFNLLKLVFKIANYAEKDVSSETLTECSSAFSRLYVEIQTTVRHEVNCTAETVLHGVFGSAVPPESISSIHLFTTALLSVVDIYPFESLTEKEMFSGSTVEFNALGKMTTFVNTLQLLGEKVMSLVTSDKAEKLPRSLCQDFLSILIISQKLFAAVEEPSLIRTLFLAMSGLLANMLGRIYSDDSPLKEITQDSLVAITAIVESLQNKIPGPFDDSLLSVCAPLLTRLLSGRRGRSSKLRIAALGLWKNTFANAQSLTYPVDLRKALLPLVKKRAIKVPGFSKVNDFNGDALTSGEETSFTTSPSNSSQLSSRPRRTRKSVKVEGEDSLFDTSFQSSPNIVEASSSQTGKKRSKSKAGVEEDADTPIIKMAKKGSSSPEDNVEKPSKVGSSEKTGAPFKSPKPEEVTPSRQSVTPRTKRRVYVGLLDEDSVDYVPIVSSESAKKMKLTDRQREMFSEKRDRMPFLDEDSQNSAVIAHLPSEFDAEMSQSTSYNPTNLGLTSCAESANDQIEKEQKDLPHKEVASVSPTTEVKLEGSVEDIGTARRKPKLKLNFDEAGNCELGRLSPGNDALETEKIDKTEETKEPSGQAGNSSSVDEVCGSDESNGFSVESVTENVENDEVLCSRRSRKKGTPLKYVGQKKRESNKSVEKEQKTPSTPKKRRSSNIVQEQSGDCADSKTLPPLIQEASAQQSEEVVVLREMDDVLNVTAPNNTGLDESLDEEDDVIETPQKQNQETENIAATPTPAFVQRIAGTPGILKKVDSPSTAEKKLRRVHFGGAMENNALDVTADDPVKAITSSDLIPVSPKGIVKRATPRRPFFHLQTTVEQVSKVAALPNESIAASPIKSEADFATFTDDEPIFPRLADCQESIGRIVGRLLPISSTNNAIAARKSLEAQGIVKICDLASKSRREVSLLNIKKPRIETALRTLSQFARDHLKSETSPPAVITEVTSVECVEVEENVVLEAVKATGTAASFTVLISESSEAELEVAGSNKMNPAECHSVLEKSEVKSVEMEQLSVPTDYEKKRLFDAVRETCRQVEAEMDSDGPSADFVQLRRAASKAARALLDVVSWCDDATPQN